jgi:hypothetical protein
LKEKEYKKYKRYLRNLADYLRDFFKRTQPLTDFSQVESQHGNYLRKGIDVVVDQDFEYRWKEGTVRGWEKKEEDQTDIEKNALYCAPCRKLFTNSNVFVQHHNGKKHKQNMKDMEKNLMLPGKKIAKADEAMKKDHQPDAHEIEAEKERERRKKLAYLESFVMRMKDLLSDIIHDTINQIQKKQSSSWQELQRQAQGTTLQEDAKPPSDDEDDDEPVYNPKNLPLGWDGKPIPYWLYKLHGLGLEYKCEICGNYSYWGRRAYERHFQEWRHAYGMKCLRIPNTVHFKEITSINDALARIPCIHSVA